MKNKENTKRKLLDAVGVIIKRDGFNGLGVNKVAKLAGVSKILIYRYFGNFDQLVKSYVAEKNFWTNNQVEPPGSEHPAFSMREHIGTLLKERFHHFYNHCEMEAIVLNDTSGFNRVIKHRSEETRLYHKKAHAVKESSFGGCITYFNVVSALLVAGTNHLVLSGQTENKVELLRSIGQLVEWTFGDGHIH